VRQTGAGKLLTWILTTGALKPQIRTCGAMSLVGRKEANSQVSVECNMQEKQKTRSLTHLG
jgi:hypothetical protein